MSFLRFEIIGFIWMSDFEWNWNDHGPITFISMQVILLNDSLLPPPFWSNCICFYSTSWHVCSWTLSLVTRILWLILNLMTYDVSWIIIGANNLSTPNALKEITSDCPLPDYFQREQYDCQQLQLTDNPLH